MNEHQLARVFFQHEGKLSDKWEQYLFIYETELSRFITQGQPVRLLEVGVQNGGSLEIWAKYLPPQSTIIGIDIDPAVANLSFEGNVRAFVADVNDSERVERLIGVEPFDIIIDDGSHTSSDIIAGFKSLFPRLAAGGKYIVEDLHASYWSSHEGGFRLRSSSIEYLKDMVDALNADHLRSEDSLLDAELQNLKDLGRRIGRITFYDSVAVIEKLTREKTVPYRHLISGQQALVNDPTDFILSAPIELVQPWLLGELAVHSIDLALKERLIQSQHEIETLTNNRTLLEMEVAAARHDADVQRARAAELDAQRVRNAALEEHLQGTLTKLSDALAYADAQQAHNTALDKQLTATVEKLDETQAELLGARSDIGAILNSTSWRATAALRRAVELVRK